MILISPSEAIHPAHRLMRERGSLVIGYPSDDGTLPKIGQRVRKFAGHLIPGYCLRITGDSDYAAFCEQAKVIGAEIPADADTHGVFFAAVLEPWG